MVHIFLISLLVLVMFFAVLAPPVWWYRRGQKPGEKRAKRWVAIVIGVLLIVSIGSARPMGKGEWLLWFVTMGRFVGAAWLIAWGAKGSPTRA